MKDIVLLGGGYGGMRILQRILPDLPEDIYVTLIDKSPYHGLKTEYYALAAGTISDTHVRVSFPVHDRLKTINSEVIKIDQENKQVILADRDPISYDDLIIGLGSEDKYHGVPGADKHTYSIQSIGRARKTSQRLNNLAANSVVSIVGAGLSGVELASELTESRPDLHIKLFDRGETILSAFPRKLSDYVESWLREHGVEVINKSNITEVQDKVLFNHNEPIECDAIVWTAGIQSSKIVRELDVENDNQGRVILTKHHHLPNDEHVFVVGDCASLPHAPSAQLAEGQAEQIAIVLQRRWNGDALPEEFPRIKLKGVLGSLGKKHGFGLVKDTALTGRVPRLLKSGVLWMYKNHSG
jgi:NADH dehydrogenase